MTLPRHAAQGLLAGVAVLGFAVPGAAQGKAPQPEFAVEMSFQSTLARLLADDCPDLSFDHAGFDRHFRALMAKYSDRGVNTRSMARQYAPIRAERYDPYFAAFQEKYALTADSSDADYCAAGAAEAAWRTPIGRMLKASGE